MAAHPFRRIWQEMVVRVAVWTLTVAMAAQTRRRSPRSTQTRSTATLELGSSAAASGGDRGEAAPSGTVHLVDGWDPVCGAERVRFVFPGRVSDAAADCPACAATVATSSRRLARVVAGN